MSALIDFPIALQWRHSHLLDTNGQNSPNRAHPWHKTSHLILEVEGFVDERTGCHLLLDLGEGDLVVLVGDLAESSPEVLNQRVACVLPLRVVRRPGGASIKKHTRRFYCYSSLSIYWWLLESHPRGYFWPLYPKI